MSLKEPTPGELVLIDRFFNSPEVLNPHYVASVIKFIQGKQFHWSSLLDVGETKAYSTDTVLQIPTRSDHYYLPLHVVIGQTNNATQQDDRYKLVIVSDQDLIGSFQTPIQNPELLGLSELYRTAQRLHALEETIETKTGTEQNIAMLELFLLRNKLC